MKLFQNSIKTSRRKLAPISKQSSQKALCE
jgi:hypothetical protein